MLRLKYKLFNGTSPQNKIQETIQIDSNNLYFGMYPNGDWLYGEINTDSQNQSVLETALSDWNVAFLSDNDAKAYLDQLIPSNTIIIKRVTTGSSIIDGNGHLAKEYIEEQI